MFDAVPVEMIPSVNEMKESGERAIAVEKRDGVAPPNDVHHRSILKALGRKSRKESMKIVPAGVKVERPIDEEEFKRAVARRGSFIM